MNRLWMQLSMAFGIVLVIVLVLPNLLGIYLISPLYPWQHPVTYQVRDADNTMRTLSLDEVIYREFIDVMYLSVASIIIGLIAGGFISRRMINPVTQVAKRMKTINYQDLGQRIQVNRGVQEYVDLAESFNHMMAALEEADQIRRNLLADVSHELLTPLTVLEGNLLAIIEDVYEMNDNELAQLYEQTQHLIRLVKDLRQLAQAEANQLELDMTSTNVDELIGDTVAVFAPVATDKGIALAYHPLEMSVTIPVDVGRIRQALINLISNALCHTPQGGSIQVCSHLEAGEVHISVADTGEGLDSTELEHIFDRFYRTDDTLRRDSGGSGLGLAITKALVEAHGGHVTASSAGKQQGTTFSIWIPVDRAFI